MKSTGRYISACAIAVVLAAGAALLVTLFSDDVYRAETTVAVGGETELISADFGDQAQTITNTISQLIRSNVVAQTVIQRLDLDTSPETFLEDLQIEQKPDAAVLAITYDGASKQETVDVLRELNLVFAEQFKKVSATSGASDATPTEGAQAADQTVVKVRVFDPPHALEEKVSPQPLRNLAVAVFLGLMIAIFWTAFRENSRRGPEDEAQQSGKRRVSAVDDPDEGRGKQQVS